MIPEHQNPDDSRRSNAPYNFIQLPEQVVPAQPLPDQNSYHADRMTGRIVCELVTKTRIYSRGMQRPPFFRGYERINLENIRNNADLLAYASFFRYDEQGLPVISGSTLRGMIRAVAEVVSYGKVHWVTNEPLMYRAVGSISSVGDSYRKRFFGPQVIGPNSRDVQYPAENIKGGYLIKDGSDWYIRPAKIDPSGNTFVLVNYTTCQAAGLMTGANYSPGVTDVFVQPAERSWVRRAGNPPMRFYMAQTKGIQRRTGAVPAGWQPGKLLFSHHFGNANNPHSKHRHVVIYEIDSTIPKKDWLTVDDKLMDLLWEDERISRRRDGSHNPRKLVDGSPVLYMVDDNDRLVYFGPTMMFRLPYMHKPMEYVPAYSRDEAVIDMPEAVFGFIRGGKPRKDESKEDAKRRGYAGRVFFSDAITENKTATEGLAIPGILSAPKPTSFQHYLTQNRDTAQLRGAKLYHYDADPNDTVIRGIKRYWHPGVDRAQAQVVQPPDDVRPTEIENPQSRTLIRPVKPDTKFTFTVRFENLTAEELGMMLWAIGLPAEADTGKELCHQVGMAKPYGFGTVKITPRLFVESRTERYSSLVNEDGSWSGEPDTRPEQAGVSQGKYLMAFENHVMSGLGEFTESLRTQKRIRELIAMLQYPGPSGISYSELDLFRERCVLPTPLGVIGADNESGNNKPTQGNGPGKGPQPIKRNEPRSGSQFQSSGGKSSQSRPSLGDELLDLWKKRDGKK